MKLELIDIDRKKPPLVLHQFPVIVGLDPSADICLDDSAVGHYHCMIDFGDVGLMVWDLGTRSGTFINGVRVCQNAPLRSGDELSFGKNRLLVRYEDGPAKPSKRGDRGQRRREPALPA